jgi:DNA (cytosine-5)-methyltransferase 1
MRNLIAAGHIAPGDVDERSIVDVHADDLKGYTQCHFFAGIAGWSYAARLAGYPDDQELWTGSCPCQPFSEAGHKRGGDDPRHLWPDFFRLISSRRPAVVMGEQVAGKAGANWVDGVRSDLEGERYLFRAAVVPACAVNAPQERERLWFVACSDVVDGRAGAIESTSGEQDRAEIGDRSRWPAEHEIPRLDNGVSGALGRLRAYGNAIVPTLAAEVIGAFIDVYGLPSAWRRHAILEAERAAA